MAIPNIERYCEITGRDLEEYLTFFPLDAKDLHKKVILNLGSGWSDLEEDLRRRNIFPKAVFNLDLAYTRRKNKFLQDWIRSWYGGSPGRFIPKKGAVCGDMCLLPFPSGVIDYCLSLWSLSSYLSEERRTLAVSEIIRVLKPNGRAFIHPVAPFEENLVEGIMNAIPLEGGNQDEARFGFLKPETYKGFWTLEISK